MNAEVIKAMNKKENPKKEKAIHKWWKKNGYKVMRIILFPLWLIIKLLDKIEEWSISRNKWSEERANEILDYYIPRKAKWNSDDNSFYFFDNGYGWNFNSAKKFLKRKDRKFWKANKGWAGGKIRAYLLDTFELEGFTKEILCRDDGWTEISFQMIEKKA